MTEADRRRKEDAKPAYAALMKFYPFTLENLDGEVWRPIVGYKNYQISNFGRVKSFKQDKIIIRKPKLNVQGYLRVDLCKGGKQKDFRVHRLVAQAFIPNPDNKPEVNHIDGYKMNCFVGNLEWATRLENQRHALANNLIKLGEDSINAKLINEQVKYIRQNPDKLTTTKLAAKFGVTQTVISNIQLGKIYKNAGGSIRPKRGVPEDIKQKIRAEYVFGSKEFGSRALAKKYGVAHSTILNIVREK